MLKKRSLPTQPTAEIDLAPLAAITSGILARQQAYDRAIDMLREARRELRDANDAPLPDLHLDVERELLAAAGDADALAAFDVEHGSALAAARKAADDARERATRLPARVAALEAQVKRIAQRMIEETDTGALQREAERLFAPYAERVAHTAHAHAQALREARAVSDALHARLAITEYDVHGHYSGARRIELLGDLEPGEIVPMRVAGLAYEVLRDLNDAARESDPDLSEALHAQLAALGLTRGLRLYRPGKPDDRRPVYAADATPKARRPDGGALPGQELVRDQSANASLRAS